MAPQQVEEDLGAGLPAADHGDVAGAVQGGAAVQVVGGVEGPRVAGHTGEGLGQERPGADAEHEVAGVHLLAPAGGGVEQLGPVAVPSQCRAVTTVANRQLVSRSAAQRQ